MFKIYVEDVSPFDNRQFHIADMEDQNICASWREDFIRSWVHRYNTNTHPVLSPQDTNLDYIDTANSEEELYKLLPMHAVLLGMYYTTEIEDDNI